MQKPDLRIKPEPKQALAYKALDDKITSFLGFGGGSGGGKSWLGAEWLFRNCIAYEGSKWFIGRNELKRLMASSFATFRKVSQFHNVKSGTWKLNGQYNYIEFFNKSRIDLLDLKYLPSDPMYQRFGSTEYTGGWIEEAGEVDFLAFDVLKTRVGRWKNNEYELFPAKVLLTFNPEQNWLYRVFYKPWRKDELKGTDYAFIQSLYGDNHYTAGEYGKQLDKLKDPVLRARLKMGLWEYASGDLSLLDYDSIIDIFTNTLPEEGQQEKYFSGDVARYGSDKITFASWKGFNLHKLEWKEGRGIDQTAMDVREELRTGMIPYSHAIVDDDGVGGGVVDLVRGIKGFVGNSAPMKIKVKGVPESEKERKDNYRNLRSQCAFMLAEKIKAHELTITAKIDESTKEMIIEDLQQLKRVETPTEQPLQIIPKDEIKEALGRSPDFSDTLMMRMYFELDSPKVIRQREQSGGIAPYIEGTF